MLNDLSSYVYPSLDNINLCCEVKCNLNSSVIQQALIGQIITFRRHDRQDSYFYAECDVVVKISESCAYNFMGYFWVNELVAVGDPSTDEAVYGAIVAEDTQIVMTSMQEQLKHTTSIWDYNEDILSVLSADVSHALLGCMQRYLTASSINGNGFGTLLLTGQSGSGCVTSACAAADRIGAYRTIISPGKLYAEFAVCAGLGGLTRAWGRRTVRQAVLRALAVRQPCVLILEDLHFLISDKGLEKSRAGGRQRTEAEEGMAETGALRVLVVGCAREEGLVDSQVRACFEESLHFPLPDAHQRRNILQKAWASLPAVTERQLSGLAASPPHSLLESLADNLAGTPLIPMLLRAKELLTAQFEKIKNNALDSSTNSGVGRVFDRRVAGLPQVKRALVETVLWPRRYAALYCSFAATASSPKQRGGHLGLPAGVLLFGPPGTGKTLLPRALAEELGCVLINMRLSDVVRGEVGTSEKRVRELFQTALRGAPSVVFIDEFQAIFTAQEEGGGASTLSSTLAGCFDDLNRWNRHAGAESMVTVIAATNEPWAIGTAFLRPGRLEKCVFVGPLGLIGRAECVAMLVDNCTTELAEDVARCCEGFTGADMVLLCARAKQQYWLRSDRGKKDCGALVLTVEDFVVARRTTPASTHRDDIAEFLDWQSMHPYLNTDLSM